MNFFLLVLLTALFLLRPQDYVEALGGVPIFNVTICILALASTKQLSDAVGSRGRPAKPVTNCVVGVVAGIFFSHLARLDLWAVRTFTFDFLKVFVFYLLVFSTLDTPAKLRKFLSWFVALTAALTALALLNYYNLLKNPAIKLVARMDAPEGGLLQLVASGTFNDPNDFCMILTAGTVVSLYEMFERRSGFARVLWVGPAALFIVALMLARSRGGLLAFLASLGCLLVLRVGWRKAALVGGVCLPVLALGLTGRAAQLSTEDESAHSRLEFWRLGFQMLSHSPLFGIGAGQFVEVNGLVAHNSFVQASAELGLPGGACFTGVLFVPFLMVYRSGPGLAPEAAAEFGGLRPYLAAMLLGAFVSLFSITRCYALFTYLLPGLSSAYLILVDEHTLQHPWDAPGRVLAPLLFVYACLLAAIYVMVRVLI